MNGIPTLVLDTNAWLDLLVFKDSAIAALGMAVEDGAACIAIDVRAIAELDRVLRYPLLQLDASAADAYLARAMQLSTCIDVQPIPLPRCRDPDDQMFLEIAVVAAATMLLTRDAELLRMARRMAREHGVAIVEPSMWRNALPARGAGATRADQMSNR